MPLSPADQAVLADMEQREIHLKRRRQAESLIAFRARRFTTMLICVGVVIGVLISLGVIEVARMLMNHESGWVVPTILNAIFAAFLGSEVTQHLLRTRLGQRWIARFERRQRERFSAELHAGRRWLEFYYKRENIGPYVPQVLLFLREGRFDSVAEAVDFARSSRRESPLAEARALERFQTIAHEATGLVVSSTDREGQPSSRVMRFVTTERPGVWLITTAPYAPKVPELELGRIAIETLPTADGSTISSNRAWIGLSAMSFSQAAALYQEQVPGYVSGMTENEYEVELVYEIVLHSAKVHSWVEHDVVEFGEPRPGRHVA